MAWKSRLTKSDTRRPSPERRALGGLLVVASLPLLLTACSSSTTASSTTAPSTTTTVSIPRGWKTYTLGKMAIAVPSSWAVKHDTNCPNAAAPGTLLLGVSPVLINCPAFEYPATVVTVSQLSTETSTTTIGVIQHPVTINGVRVYPGDGSPGSLHWTVPSLDVQVVGMGPDSSQVLHTIHRS